MGKEWWVKKQYDKMKKIDSAVKIESIEKSYRKTLYCPGFTSRNHLYGLYEVLNGGENMENLVVVEGERDAIKLLQEGIDCVSVHGTSLKDEQKTMIKKINPRRLYLGFDMDKAGNEATEKAYNALIGEVEDLYVLNFPENQDPKKFNYNELNELITYTTNNRVRERII
jgi:DNA primase